jgi:hypothetical protein
MLIRCSTAVVRSMALLTLVATPLATTAQVKFDVLLTNIQPEAFNDSASQSQSKALDPPQFLCRDNGGRKSEAPLGGPRLLRIEGFKACTKDRTTSSQGDLVRVHQLYIDPAPDGESCKAEPPHKILVKENKRQTVLADGAKKVVDLIKGKLLPQDKVSLAAAHSDPPKPVPVWCVASREERLMHTRALLDFKVRKDGKEEGAIMASTEIVTGPPEHTFLSGDALPGGAKELRWDEAAKRLAAPKDPKQIYLGVNYMLGDLWGDYKAWDPKNRTTLKLMLSPSRRPFDSFGMGIGYRFADGVFTTGDSKAGDGGFMIFVGHFWTRSDGVDAAGAPVAGGGRVKAWRIGVSYSLDTLLGWVNK